jgi:hypothetical protein
MEKTFDKWDLIQYTVSCIHEGVIPHSFSCVMQFRQIGFTARIV